MHSVPSSVVAPGLPGAGCGSTWHAHLSRGVLSGLTRAAASLLHAPLGLVTLGDAAIQRRVADSGRRAGHDQDGASRRLEGLCARVVEQGRVVLLESGATGEDWRPEVGEGERWSAFAGAPLWLQGRAVGVLAVLDSEPRGWTQEEVRELRGLAEAASTELERARLQARTDELSIEARKSEGRYARLTQTSYVGIYTTDLHGHFTEVNDAGAAVLGRPAAEVLGKNFRGFIAPEDWELAERSFAERLAGVCEGEVELRVVRPTGERRLLEISCGRVLEDGLVIGTQGVVRDITEERAREMQFRRAERMASVAPLLSGVCHELNNPLTSIKSFAELLLLDDRSPEDREALEIVQREAQRAAKIVTDLRLVARQSQETGTGRGMVDLSSLVRHVVESRGISLVGLKVQLDLAPGLPFLWAVRLHLEQVVVQLLVNAVHALQERSEPRELTVRTYAGGMGIALQVEDTGQGIHPDHLDRIFDPFWTTKQPGEGTGLGLSLVHGIVTDHGGRIQVDSVVDRGTRFVVEFPVVEQPVPGLAVPDSDSNSSRPLRILVVDDEAAIRYSLTRYMERRGHRVHEAAEGAAALSLLDEGGDDAYDVIVADLRMPGLNGGELLRRLRERQGALEERLIFITGDTDSSDLQHCGDLSGIPLVQKPFELAEIAQIIETQAGVTAL